MDELFQAELNMLNSQMSLQNVEVELQNRLDLFPVLNEGGIVLIKKTHKTTMVKQYLLLLNANPNKSKV